MKNSLNLKFLLFAAMLIMVTSCVTQKRYADLETKYKKCNDDLTTIEKSKNDIAVQNTELNAVIEKMKKERSENEMASTEVRNNFDKLLAEQTVLSADYAAMQQKYNKLLGGNRAETSEIMEALQKTQSDLLKKENDLKKTETEMQLMQLQLNEKKKNLDNLSAEMDVKEKKLNELQAILDNKDKQVNDLKNKITDALLGFKDKGLTINTRNGKVYVSMDEKLLFASGSWNIAEDGKTALRNVAKVLELNPDINVMIEGHTDNVPYNGAGQVKDNWDLSVLRATSIVKIILENKGIEAQRIIASGRSQYVPVEAMDTKEARAKNRRTEIILTPKMDALFKILESN
jgi:chemotaxis protein MotB